MWGKFSNQMSCMGLVLQNSEGFLRLQCFPQLCSRRYLQQQIILNLLPGSQLLHQESTTTSSCMLNSLHIQKGTKALAYLLAGRVHACVFTCIHACVCVCVLPSSSILKQTLLLAYFYPPFNLLLSSLPLFTATQRLGKQFDFGKYPFVDYLAICSSKHLWCLLFYRESSVLFYI